MKVTVLVENTGCGAFAGEHGLSLYVEHEGAKYLIDAGASGLFLENAKKLGIDLAEVDAAFLSHAHYDHSGGFDAFFEVNARAKVYLQRACRGRYYYKIAGLLRKYIGIPEGLLERHPDRFEYADGYCDMGNGVHICPHTAPDLALRGERAHMYGLTGGHLTVDDFAHEQTVVFETPRGLVLFNSCSHGGVENIVDEIKTRFPGRPVAAFFGGFHMMGAAGVDTCAFTEPELRAVANRLLTTSGAAFYTGHCTGNIAARTLASEMGERFIPIHTGMTISL